MQALFLILSAGLMITFNLAGSAYAMPPRVHSLIAYEASFLPDVPSEIGIYIGDPENCLQTPTDTICQGAYDEDDDRDPRMNPQNIFTWLGLFNWGTHFWNPDGGPQEEGWIMWGRYR
ncbi:MAG: hypothetical protein JRG73_17260 [Deltaproteobacteria bacterium]|nr:hypothetical protein [Deltaproteobacteria bacterium]MBW2308675.1 hypothetical protein [Deltaproteobacteria bacterium]